MITLTSKRLAWLLLFTMAAAGCKPRRVPLAETKDTTAIDGEYVDLTAYKANGESLSTREVDALKKYSSEDATSNGEKYYVRLNKALRKFIKADVDQYEGIIKNVSSGINKLRNGSCNFYRYIDADQNLANQMMRTGQTYIERGFFSTTKNNRAPKGFENKLHVIVGTSAQCADISNYSRIPSEREVLFPPGSEFKVTKDFDGSYFYLEEIAPGGQKTPKAPVGTLGSEGADTHTLSAGGGDIGTLKGTFQSAKGSQLVMEGEGKYKFKWWQYSTYSNISKMSKIDAQTLYMVLGPNEWFRFEMVDEDRLNVRWYGGTPSLYTRVGAPSPAAVLGAPVAALANPYSQNNSCADDPTHPRYAGTATNTQGCLANADRYGIPCAEVLRDRDSVGRCCCGSAQDIAGGPEASGGLGGGGVCSGDRPIYVGRASSSQACFKLADRLGVKCLHTLRLGTGECCCSR